MSNILISETTHNQNESHLSDGERGSIVSVGLSSTSSLANEVQKVLPGL